MPTLTQATKSSCVIFSPSKNLWKSTGGAAGKFAFHMLLDVGSESLRTDTARLYLAQLALFRSLLEPTTVYAERWVSNMSSHNKHGKENARCE